MGMFDKRERTKKAEKALADEVKRLKLEAGAGFLLDPQSWRDMGGNLTGLGKAYASLDKPGEMSAAATMGDMGLGALPVVGTAQSLRDLERARRDDDPLGMGVSALAAGAGVLPFGGMFGAGLKRLTRREALDIVKEAKSPGYLGGTIPLATGKQPERGYAVAPKTLGAKRGTQFKFDPADLKASDVEKFVRDARMTDKDALGLWMDKGKLYLDKSAVFPSRFRAVNEGNANKQLAAWDLARAQEVTLAEGEKANAAAAALERTKVIEKELRDAGFKGTNKKYSLDKSAREARADARYFLKLPVAQYERPSGSLLDFRSWATGDLPDMSAFSTISQDGFLPRYVGKNTIGRLEGITKDAELQDLMLLAAKRGRKLGGDFWYNNSPVYEQMKALGLPDEEFARWVAQNYSTSARTSVMPQISHASIINYGLKKGMFGPNDDPGEIATLLRNYHLNNAGTGKSLQLMDTHIPKAMDFERKKQFITGFDDAQKYSGYGHGLAGFANPVANDTHEINYLASLLPASRRAQFFDKEGNIKLLSPQEYPVLERLYQEMAPTLDMTGSSFQANRWIGGGPLTWLRSPPIPFSDAVERLIAWNAVNRGIKPEKMRDDYLTGKDYLYPYLSRKNELPPAAEILKGMRGSADPRLLGGLALGAGAAAAPFYGALKDERDVGPIQKLNPGRREDPNALSMWENLVKYFTEEDPRDTRVLATKG